MAWIFFVIIVKMFDVNGLSERTSFFTLSTKLLNFLRQSKTDVRNKARERFCWQNSRSESKEKDRARVRHKIIKHKTEKNVKFLNTHIYIKKD
jgi:hypothetical protein